MIEYITIDESLQEPKYVQIVNSILDHILLGNIAFNTKMPSLRALGNALNLSRDTVDKAYHILRERKIITSVRGKGNYISKTDFISESKILFLANKMDAYKLDVFNAFNENIGKNAQVDLQLCDCEASLYENLLEKHQGAYDHYVIMLTGEEGVVNKNESTTENIEKVLQHIPKEKLIFLDDMNLGLDGDVVEIYQDFENDIYNVLFEGFYKIKNYKRLILTYPKRSMYQHPERIVNGVQKFCKEKSLDFIIIDEIADSLTFQKGDLIITLEEDDLVKLVSQVRKSRYEMGSEIGVLSYNDTPLKELSGISVIASDLKNMGATAAQMIVDDKKGKVKNPFHFIGRRSL